MIEIFKTNVENKEDADIIVQYISERVPYSKVNFDLADRDRILRVEADVSTQAIIQLVEKHNFICEILED